MFLLICASMYIEWEERLVLAEMEMLGRWSKNRRYVFNSYTFRREKIVNVSRSMQARYFKSMMKEADHLEKIKRLRVGEKDTASLVPYYEVRDNFLLC